MSTLLAFLMGATPSWHLRTNSWVGGVALETDAGVPFAIVAPGAVAQLSPRGDGWVISVETDAFRVNGSSRSSVAVEVASRHGVNALLALDTGFSMQLAPGARTATVASPSFVTAVDAGLPEDGSDP